MTPDEEEWVAAVAWAKRWEHVEEPPGTVYACGGAVVAAKFPVPDTTGLSPEQAEAALDRWRADVAAFYASQASAPPVPNPQP
jgi:hypothetical protein